MVDCLRKKEETCDMPDVLILLHGYHLNARGWEHVVWGEPADDIYGRVPRALSIAAEYQNPLIFWGGGGSVRDGVAEADISFALACERYQEMEGFSDYTPRSFRHYLKSIVHINHTATTTTEEVVAATSICCELSISKLVVVSSPTHITRCHQEALVAQEAGFLPGVRISAESSDTSYPGYGARDVVVVEPPHRGDMPQIPFHENARQLFPFLRDEEVATGFNDAWSALIEQWLPKLRKE